MSIRKILIVEDSTLLQKGYNLILQRYKYDGCKVLSALNGKEAIELLATNPDCDLIILDINMPVMSGLEFLHHCKHQPALCRIPVIISSTEGKEEDIVRGLQAGAAAYLVKPFDPDELHKLIGRVIPGGFKAKPNGTAAPGTKSIRA